MPQSSRLAWAGAGLHQCDGPTGRLGHHADFLRPSGYLGDKVELIAAEKAGIIKKGCPVVIGIRSLKRRGTFSFPSQTGLDAQPPFTDRILGARRIRASDLSDEFGLGDLPLPRLPGRHQLANAAAAIRAVKAAVLK